MLFVLCVSQSNDKKAQLFRQSPFFIKNNNHLNEKDIFFKLLCHQVIQSPSNTIVELSNMPWMI